MSVHQSHQRARLHLPALRRTGDGPVSDAAASGAAGQARQRTGSLAVARAAAVARIVLGLVFLWAFLDKTFGWGYATPSSGAWVNGGSPAKGFLGGVSAGPFESMFHSWAGQVWVDWLFMLGLLGVGLAFLAGIALRPAAVAGTVMMAFMWAAEWPPASHLSDGSPSMSSNPVIDYHLVYAVLLIALAIAAAGRTWGLGGLWQQLPLVRRNPWLK
ncbi:hypothetical protein [Streptomyces sp. NPDC050560]|uniref:hypothetical protein n=1 Tax=Streptomyces sp. NPDC050560 TaxID=3365630 RepID=UPI0037B5B8EA